MCVTHVDEIVRVEGIKMNRDVKISISCRDCVRQSTPDCADCLVSFVLGGDPEQLTMTAEDVAVVELLTAERLVPRLRFRGASK